MKKDTIKDVANYVRELALFNAWCAGRPRCKYAPRQVVTREAIAKELFKIADRLDAITFAQKKGEQT